MTPRRMRYACLPLSPGLLYTFLWPPLLLLLLERSGLCYGLPDSIGPNQIVPTAHEYCQWDTFNATCPGANEIVLITAARYGRMRAGRCLPVDYYVGCFADVLDQVEQRCSGRSGCTIQVPDAELFRIQPCRKDLVAYFEAAYRCVAVSGLHRSTSDVNNVQSPGGNQSSSGGGVCRDGSPIPVSAAPFGYLASQVAAPSNRVVPLHPPPTASLAVPGSPRCPWLLQAPAGQRINVTLMDFTSPYKPPVVQQQQQQQQSHDLLAGSGGTAKQRHSSSSSLGGGGAGVNSATWCPVVVRFREEGTGDGGHVAAAAGQAVGHGRLPSRPETGDAAAGHGGSESMMLSGSSSRETEVRACDSRVRKRVVYTSRTNKLRVVMPMSEAAFGGPDSLQAGYLTGHYVLYFEASGCADLPAPENAWLQRKGDTLQVACNHTAERWHLVCKGNEWVGAFGNCSASVPHGGRNLHGGRQGSGSNKNLIPGQTAAEEAHGVHLQQFPFGLLIAIAIGAIVGIVVGCIFLLTVFTFRKRFNRHGERVLTSADYDQAAGGPPGGTVLLRDQTTIYASSGRENTYKSAADLQRSAVNNHHIDDYGAAPALVGLYSTSGGGYPPSRGGWGSDAADCPSCGGDSGCGADGDDRCGCGREMMLVPAGGGRQPGTLDDAEVCFTEELVRRKLLFGRCQPPPPNLVVGAEEPLYTPGSGRNRGGGNAVAGPELAMRTFKGGPQPSRQTSASGVCVAGCGVQTSTAGTMRNDPVHVCGGQ